MAYPYSLFPHLNCLCGENSAARGSRKGTFVWVQTKTPQRKTNYLIFVCVFNGSGMEYNRHNSSVWGSACPVLDCWSMAHMRVYAPLCSSMDPMVVHGPYCHLWAALNIQITDLSFCQFLSSDTYIIQTPLYRFWRPSGKCVTIGKWRSCRDAETISGWSGGTLD